MCANGNMAMKLKNLKTYEARARVAKALSHPSRLLILDVLSDEEQCVCDLTELVGSDQSTVSKHLAILREAGLIEGRKEGSMTFYRVKVGCLEGFFSCLESVLRENLRTQRAAVGR